MQFIFFIKIFIHIPYGLFYLFAGSLLRLFLEAIEQNNQTPFIEATEYPVDVAAFLYPYLIKSLHPLYCSKILRRYDFLSHYQ